MEHNNARQYEVKVKKLPHSMIEITAAISAADFDNTRPEAIKHIAKNAELPGFRKGHVPEQIIITKVGESAILEEMAELSIGKAYPEIILQEKLDVLGRPEIRITKIAMGNPLQFTLQTAVFPEIKLPDYKKLAGREAKKKTEVAVTDEELEETMTQVRRMRMGDNHEEKKPAEDGALPPLDDEYVKTLGDFSGVDDFKTKLRENMLKEKERAAHDKKRIAIIDAILADTTIELPDVIVIQELARMEEEFAHDVVRMGLTMDGYLKAVAKTKEDLQKEWRPDAEKRAKTQLLVSAIAEQEKLEPDKETLEKEVAALRTRYPDAPEDRAESYIRMLLTNEKVFQLLEKEL